jgi:hypothetical protein
MTHRDRPRGPSGRRMAAGGGPIGKAFRRPPTGRRGDRNGGLPRLSDGVACASRCAASPRLTLLAENLGKPSHMASL